VSESVLEARNLTVRYGRAVACDRIRLSVARGSVFALMGRNGAGKSSLVRCLLGQQKPAEGDAELFGANAWKTRADAMDRVGVVPEEPDAPPAMTSRQISNFCSRLYERWNAAAVASLNVLASR
jgi:ABC-2 type transport system ATP-binding protein